MNSFQSVWIHQSMRAGEQAKKRMDSLAHGEMDHGFHYQGVKQASLWLEVHRRHAPLFTDPSFKEIFQAISADTAERLAGQTVHVIGLGPGGGEKEAWLLEALRNRGCRLRYTPVDTGIELAMISAEAAFPYVETEIIPVVGDLSLLQELPIWLERYPKIEIRVYTAYGLTPNFLPSQLFPWLSGVVSEQDSLLLSANLAPAGFEEDSEDIYRAACSAILPQYDNLETRQWLRQILVDWGIASNFSELVFQVRSIENILGFEAACTWLGDVNFPWEGRPFQASQGERLRLFFSLRYTPLHLEATLKQYGLSLGSGYVTTCGQEGVWKVTKTLLG